LTSYMAKEFSRRGIRVNSVAPGATRTRIGDDAYEKCFIAQSSGRFPADFDLLTAVDCAAFDVVAVGMWATRLRCPSCPQRCCAFAL
jgi:NAD(P)-dependent dehydrogenase (short-subunit alcohol dehydrogenase family)